MGPSGASFSGQSILYLERFSMIEPSYKAPFRTVLFVVLLVAVWAMSDKSYANEVFTVQGIKVDVTAETAAKARTQALAQGERMAFAKLIERLTMRIDRELLPELSAEQISSYIRDFEVADEKILKSATLHLSTTPSKAMRCGSFCRTIKFLLPKP